MSIITSNEMFINMKTEDIPPWDPKKTYWDQNLSTIDFYQNEYDKIKYGTKIGGYHIHPWLYFHLNYFKTPIPQPGDGFEKMKEVIMHPPMDDNILYIIETYQEAERNNLGLCMFGCRGFSKTSALTSLITWLNTTKENGTTSVIGGDLKDLGAISTLMKVSFNRMNPAFKMPRLITDWDKEVEFGFKDRQTGDRRTFSRLSITNANKGNENESEKGAGLSPVGFIMDEIGKFNPKGALTSALPSFNTQYGAKLVHVLSGTGGNTKLSKEAREILSNPTAFKLIMMNWDRLDRSVPEEAITWNDDRKKNFSLFVPAHMSYRLEVPKLQKKLGDFIELPHPDLNKISINVTDWVAASEKIEAQVAAHKKEDDRNKERMYFPRTIDDCFLTESANPFPVEVTRRQIDKLASEGRIGKNIEIFKDGSKTKYEYCSKRRAEVKHQGGLADAPIILFGDLPEFKPGRNIFVSGFDGYKLDQSDTDSLGSVYVLKRRHLTPNSPCETIMCSYTARPERMKDFNINAEKIVDAWNAECCMESIDMSFKQYLDEKGKAEQVLCPAFSFADSTSKNPNKLDSRFGLYPSKQNNQYRFQLLVDYTREQHVMGHDEEGNEIIKYGVEFIDDIDLLQEMLDYSEGGNFDRIIAFSHALVLARELDKKNVRPADAQREVGDEVQTLERPRMGFYSNVRHNPYRR